MKGKLIFTAFLSAILVLGVAGCGNKKADTVKTYTKEEITAPVKDKITVRFAYNAWDQSIIAYTAAIEKANSLLKNQGSGITIEGVKIPASDWNDYYSKIATQIAAKKGPDIGVIAESFVPQVITKGMAIDITQFVEAGLDKSKYFDATFQGSAYRDGKYFGLPSSNYFMLMYYNKDMFAAAGLPEPSKDWNNAISFNRVREYALAMTKGDGANKAFGFHGGPYMSFVGMYSVSNGGNNIFDSNGNCTLTSPQSLAVYKWFDDMYHVDKSLPTPTDTTLISPADMFKAGKLAMMVDGSWTLPAVKEIEGINIGLAAVPAGLGKAYSSMFLDDFIIWKGTQNPLASWQALAALYSDEVWDLLTKFNFCGIPISRKALDDNRSALLGAKFSAEDVKCFIGGLEHTLKVPYNEFYEQVDQQANNIMDEWTLGKIKYDEYAKKVSDIVMAGKAKAEAERTAAASRN